ncbi:LytR family transcriptional regulator [Staphylococcus casei]|uniref:LCP family protein n=1 Tax=Staphylococcus TaxID=1279 RepID=UPI000CD2BE15|nr:LCP family protein [Staphylococcus casei]PNZ59283.1 LytR family transcriptional regulator [Staphylococcus casei]PTI74353.1 LytR family transcriptional regulator [Staphylococcus succinus]WJE85327.1 LCP family protein [Staphylococcus casei]
MNEDKQNNNEHTSNETNQRPMRRVKKKRIRKLPIIILILVIILAIVIGYSVHGYNAGIDYAKDHGKTLKQQKFNGAVKNDGKITIMVLGADKEQGGISRTDSIMIAQYDYIHKKMKMMSVMRDIYADIPGNGQHKINSAYSIGGPELLRQTLKKNLGIDPEYYAILDFTGFEKMIDELEPNGVPIDVEKDMSENIGVSLKKGHHRLNGKELLGYARFRHDPEGDFGRVRRQQQVMQSLKKELVSLDTLPKLPRVAGILRGYLNTNMPDSALMQTGLNFGIRGDKDIDSITLPIKGTYQDIQTPADGSSLEIDKAKNKEEVKKFLNE